MVTVGDRSDQHVTMPPLARGVLQGDRRSIARAISSVEAREEGARVLLSALCPHTGTAHLVGVTGPPGVGKSTLINQLARAYRRRDVRVGIIGVDPTSPFTGGALLGDRIRMRDLAGDRGVFIRSMATRGAVGGLAQAAFDAAQILDAAEYEIIFVETVGAGQDEVEIARLAHTTVVIEAPGLGDDIQAIKAGLMEIADVFVVNKADRAGADQAIYALQAMLGGSTLAWCPPICRAIALDGTGMPDLVTAIESHRVHLESKGQLEEIERQRARVQLERLLQGELFARFLARLDPGILESVVSRIALRDLALYDALKELGM